MVPSDRDKLPLVCRVTFTYVNHKGVEAERDVVLFSKSVFFGTTKYHHTKQYLIKGFCLTKNALRTFTMSNITNLKVVSNEN